MKHFTFDFKHLMVATTFLCASSMFAQSPEIDAWMMNTTGHTATYEYYPGMPPTTSTVNMTDSTDILQRCYDTDYVYIRTNGLPSHDMGPWSMNPNVPAANSSTYRFPRNPQEETGTHEDQPFVGALGIAVNGVQLYGAGDSRTYDSGTNDNTNPGDGLWYADAWVSEGATMDADGSGHPDGMGNYHYHATPIALYSGTNHSPIIGYAFDGFPIYGPYGYDQPFDDNSPVVRMQTGYELRTMTDRSTLPGGATSSPAGPPINSTFPLGTYWQDYEYTGAGHLNEYNGRWCVTPEYPDTIFAYFITMDASMEPEFPYILGFQYYGSVNASEIGASAGGITIPTAANCGTGTQSIEEQSFEFSVYPNPAAETLNVSGVKEGTFAIFDQLGRQVSTGQIAEQIDIAPLEAGVYVVQIELNGQTSRKQFVKK